MQIQPTALVLTQSPGISEAGSENQSTAAATSPATPPENEPATRKPAPAKNSLRDKLRRASQSVFGFSKGRGRPKKCRVCDGGGCESCEFTGVEPGKLDARPADITGDAAPGDAVASAAVVGTVPPVANAGAGVPPVAVPAPVDTVRASRWRRACVSAVGGVMDILRGCVRTFAKQAGIREEFSKSVLKETAEQTENVRVFCDDLDAVLLKHQCEPKHTEEIALAISGARLVAPFALMIAEFRGEIARQRGERNERNDVARERQLLANERAALDAARADAANVKEGVTL